MGLQTSTALLDLIMFFCRQDMWHVIRLTSAGKGQRLRLTSHVPAAEDYIPRLLSTIARPDSGAADQAQLAAAAVLPTILEDSSTALVPAGLQASASAMRPPLGVLSNVQPFPGGRFRRKRTLGAASKLPSSQLEAGGLPAAAQGTEVTVARRNARLAWARRMTQAPMRVVRAARTTYVPLGQQVCTSHNGIDPHQCTCCKGDPNHMQLKILI